MHVNYQEQGQTLEDICKFAVAKGFEGVEFRRKRSGLSTDEPAGEYLSTLKRAVASSGLKQVLFGGPGFDFMSPDAAKRGTELETALDFFKRARDLFPLTVCNVMAGALINPDKTIPYGPYEPHGSSIAIADQWHWAAESFRALGDLAARGGFRLAFETHMGYIHDTPRATKKLVDLIVHSQVGVNLDYGNAVYFKECTPLVETIKEMSESLFYVHLKNSLKLGEHRLPTALSEGEINHRQYLSTLRSVGYQGPICIEAPRPGDRAWYAARDLEYLDELMAI